MGYLPCYVLRFCFYKDLISMFFIFISLFSTFVLLYTLHKSTIYISKDKKFINNTIEKNDEIVIIMIFISMFIGNSILYVIIVCLIMEDFCVNPTNCDYWYNMFDIHFIKNQNSQWIFCLGKINNKNIYYYNIIDDIIFVK